MTQTAYITSTPRCSNHGVHLTTGSHTMCMSSVMNTRQLKQRLRNPPINMACSGGNNSDFIHLPTSLFRSYHQPCQRAKLWTYKETRLANSKLVTVDLHSQLVHLSCFDAEHVHIMAASLCGCQTATLQSEVRHWLVRCLCKVTVGMSCVFVMPTKKADFVNRACLKPLFNYCLASVQTHVLAISTCLPVCNLQLTSQSAHVRLAEH